MKVKQRRSYRYEYRILWQHVGSKTVRKIVSEHAGPILRQLRRVGTDDPLSGITKTNLRKCWTRLHLSLGVPFNMISRLKASEVLGYIRESYGETAWARVEFRQVGEWTELLDPVENLTTQRTITADAKMRKLIGIVDAMTPEELDAWRLVPFNTTRPPIKANGNERFVGRFTSWQQRVKATIIENGPESGVGEP